MSEMSTIGKTFISVDIQKEYERAFGFKIHEFTSFINKIEPEVHSLVFLYNGESLGFPDENEYKMWLFENGLDEQVLDTIKFYDKGYGWFRYCIDSGIEERQTVNLVKYMYENNITDSRDMTKEHWKRFLGRSKERIDRKTAMELLEHSGDCVFIPELMDYLKPLNNIMVTGGGINECLKEVEIALQALGKAYVTYDEFTY